MAILTVTSAADSGAGSLRAAIAAAQSGDTIRFSSALANQTITLASQLEISAGKALTIDGGNAPNLSISGNNQTRILLINSSSATPTRVAISNLNLINGYTSDRGGAISTTHQTALTINGVSFSNNVADRGGGAIFSAFEGTLTVNNSQFTNNRAIAANDERGAGAIAFWGPRALTVTNSDFIGNRGINGGAINSLNGKLTVDNSRFINNDTLSAAYNASQPNPDLRGNGGAIYTDRASSTSEPSGTIRITNSEFTGNQGRGEGGAAYLYTGAQDNVILDSNLFRNNQVTALPNTGKTGNGGAVTIMSNDLNRGVLIQDTTFASNTAGGQGGGLWMMGAPTTITNSTFSGNRVTGTGSSNVGGGMTVYGPTTIVNSTIANNDAGWVGGGLSAGSFNGQPVTVSAKNTIFYNNTARNPWNIQDHTSRQLTDQGGNIQWPPKQTNLGNDYNVSAQVRLVDPRLGPLQDNGGGVLTHALLPGSPAINTGLGGNIPSTDQRGTLRVGAPDVGAFEFTSGAFTLIGGFGNDVLKGSPGVDLLNGGDGDDQIYGGSGNDRLVGGNGNDRMEGGANNDRLLGNGGNDLLVGESGRDRLEGQAGGDILIGGRGRDQLSGGKGKDFFVFESVRDRLDTIKDFTRQDVIDFSAITEGQRFRNRNPFRNYLELRQVGSNTVVDLDIAGNRGDRFRSMVILEDVNANSLRAKNFIF